MTYTYIGVDLSRDWLDIHHPRDGHRRLANREDAIGRWLASLGPADLIVFEATSGCDGPILRRASMAGRPFHRLNPLHGWHFARSLNLPKTDRVDAAMLARMGAERQLAPSPGLDADQAELAQLTGRRAQIRRMQTQETHRLRRTRSAVCAADIRASLKALARRLARIEAAIESLLAARPRLAARARLLRTIPGIGRVTAWTLLAAMPELGTLDRRAAASLGGLAPRARESGTWRGRRSLGDGRRQVRQALYMAALSAIRGRRLCPGLVDRMRADNRPGKLIAIAVARKLLTIANALLKTNQTYKAQT